MPKGQDLATRDRLIRAASKLFLQRSYTAVGVNEICAAADAAKGSFYHFFPTKSDLAIAVIDWHADAMWVLHDKHEAAARGAAGRLRAVTEVVAEVQGKLHRSFGRMVGCPLGNLGVELATTDDPAGAHVAGVLAQWEQRIARHCHDLAEAGLLRRGVDPDELATQILATMQGMILLAKVGAGRPEPVAEAMRRVIDGAVATRRAA